MVKVETYYLKYGEVEVEVEVEFEKDSFAAYDEMGNLRNYPTSSVNSIRVVRAWKGDSEISTIEGEVRKLYTEIENDIEEQVGL